MRKDMKKVRKFKKVLPALLTAITIFSSVNVYADTAGVNDVSCETGKGVLNELMNIKEQPKWFTESKTEPYGIRGYEHTISRNSRILEYASDNGNPKLTFNKDFENDAFISKYKTKEDVSINGIFSDLFVDAVAADLDGNGYNNYVVYVGVAKDSGIVRTCVLNTDTKQVGNYCNLGKAGWMLYESKYGNIDETAYLAIKNCLKITAGDYDADGKDEIVVYAALDDNHSLFQLKSDGSSIAINKSVSSSGLFNPEYTSPNYWQDFSEYSNHMGCSLVSADVDGDDIDDLVVVTGKNSFDEAGYSGTYKVKKSYLAVSFGKKDVDNVVDIDADSVAGTYIIGNDNKEYSFCGVDVGKVLAGEDNMIIVAGRDQLNTGIFVYDARTNKGSLTLRNSWNETSIRGMYIYPLVYANTTITCAAFDGAGKQEYIFTNNLIYKINGNSLEPCKSGMGIGIVVSAHAANLEGSKTGNEVIVFSQIDHLDHNSYNSPKIQGGVIYRNDVRGLKVDLGPEINREELHGDTSFLAIPFEKIGDTITRVKLRSATYMYSNPIPRAILQTPPYFEEYGEEASEGLTSYAMSYSYENGEGTTDSSSSSKGISIEASAAVVKTSLEASWSNTISHEFEKSVKLTNENEMSVKAGQEDKVWVTITPVGLFMYDVYNPETKSWDENAMSVTVTYETDERALDIDQYNNMVDYFNNYITSEIAKNPTAGNINAKKLNKINKAEYGLGEAGDPDRYLSFKGDILSKSKNNLSGNFGTTYEHEISETEKTETSTGFDFSMSILFGYEVEGFGSFMGGSFGTGSDNGKTTVKMNSEGTKALGKVEIPKGYDPNKFDFDWELAMAKFTPYQDDTNTTIPVIGYVVSNIKRGYLSAPTITTATSDGKQDGKVTINWTKPRLINNDSIQQELESYVLEIRDGNQQTVKTVNLSATDTSYEYQSEYNGERIYHFQIKAIGKNSGGAGESLWSNDKAVYIDKEPVPSANNSLDMPNPEENGYGSFLLNAPNISNSILYRKGIFDVNWKDPEPSENVNIIGYDIRIYDEAGKIVDMQHIEDGEGLDNVFRFKHRYEVINHTYSAKVRTIGRVSGSNEYVCSDYSDPHDVKVYLAHLDPNADEVPIYRGDKTPGNTSSKDKKKDKDKDKAKEEEKVVIDWDTYKSEVPSGTLMVSTDNTLGGLMDMKAHFLDITTIDNQVKLARSMALILGAKDIDIIGTFGIYPRRDLTFDEDGSKQKMRYKLPRSITANTVVYGQCYTAEDGPFIILGLSDNEGYATFSDFILRRAVNITVFTLEN